MSVVVISQPMLFPWVGLFEQISLADVYVHHADIQWSKSGFVHRVQLKAPVGRQWLNIPLQRGPVAMTINDLVAAEPNWKQRHLRLLGQYYGRSPFGRDMISFVESLYSREFERLADFLEHQLEAMSRRLGIADAVEFRRTDGLGLRSVGSDRVLDIVHHVGGTTYVTGHGARNYLDHERFETEGVAVRYMDYRMTPYPQAHGDFTPYVSILDLIANVGFDDARRYISPRTVDWREFCADRIAAS